MLASTFTKTPVAFGLARLMSSMPEFEFVKVERKGTDGRVGLVTLNRPKALNALFNPLMDDLIAALNHFDNDKTVGAMVLTGKLVSKFCNLLNQQFILINKICKKKYAVAKNCTDMKRFTNPTEKICKSLPKSVKEAETCGQWTSIQYQQLKKSLFKLIQITSL